MRKLIIISMLLFAGLTSRAQISDKLLQDTIDLWIVTNNAKLITAARLNTILTHLNANKLHKDSSYWQLRGSSEDTITAPYNVYQDSSFLMNYNGWYAGYLKDDIWDGNSDSLVFIGAKGYTDQYAYLAAIHNDSDTAFMNQIRAANGAAYTDLSQYATNFKITASDGSTVVVHGFYPDSTVLSGENVYMPDITSDGGKFEYLMGIDPNGRLFPQPLASGYDSMQKAIAAAPTAYSTWVRDTTAQRLSPANTTDTVYIPEVLKLGSDLYAPEIGFQLVPSTEMNVLVKNDATGLIHTYPLSQFQTTMDTSGTGLWQLDSANHRVYLNDLDWKVGIGTSTPSDGLTLKNAGLKVTNNVTVAGTSKSQIILKDTLGTLIKRKTHCWTGSTWAADQILGIGLSAAENATGGGLFIGDYAGQYSTKGNGATYVGYAAGQNAQSFGVTAVGHLACNSAICEDATAYGYQAMTYALGRLGTAIGYSSLFQNTGAYVTGVGYYSARRNNSNHVIKIGHNLNPELFDGLEYNTMIDYEDIDTVNNRIYVPAHTFGGVPLNEYVLLRFDTISGIPPDPLSDSTYYTFKIVSNDSIEPYNWTLYTRGDGNYKLVNWDAHNTISIGDGVMATKPNQVIIGDTNITETVLNGEVITNGGYSYEDPTPYMRSFRAAPIYSNDFFSNSTPLPWSGSAITSGTFTVPATPEENHPGVCMIKSSASANSGYRLITNTTSMLPQPGGRMEAIFKVVNTANTIATFGFFDATDGDSASVSEGYYIWINGTKLRGNVVNLTDPGEATTATSYTITQDVWYTMAVEMNTTKDTATFELYSEAGVLLWTDTVTDYVSNIGYVHSGLAAQRTTTTAKELIYLDYMALSFKGLGR